MSMRVNPQRQFLSHKCLPANELLRPCSPRAEHNSTEIGEYRIQPTQLLGKGSFSKVYLAKSSITRQRVAVKVVRAKDLRDQISKDLLRNQMTTIKEMRSPYVLCCLDIFMTEEATYIVTQYCESDLGKLIKQCGKLEKNQVLSLFSQLVKGYHHIRELGYIHRDLKPANILLRGSTAKIADFGFSKQINREGWVKQRYNIGSPLYMPPESLSDNVYSERSDVWGLGIILYEMLTGKTPYRAQDQKTLLLEMLTLKIPQIIRENTPHEFHAILEGCLRIDRTKRFELVDVARTMNIDFTDLDFTHSPILDDQQEYYRKIDKVLVNELNYVEFLRKLNAMLEQRKVDQLSAKVKYIVGRNLRCRVAKLARIQTKANVYELPKWDAFVRKANFSSYLTVVARLTETVSTPLQAPQVITDKRFNSIVSTRTDEHEKLLLTYQYFLRLLLKQFHDELRQNHQANIKCNSLLVLADFLMSAYQLNALHIEYYLDPASFAECSCLGIIVNGQPLIDDTVWQGLLQKFRVLQLL